MKVIQQTDEKLVLGSNSYGGAIAIGTAGVIVSMVSLFADAEVLGESNLRAIFLASCGLTGLAVLLASASRLSFDKTKGQITRRRLGLIPIKKVLPLSSDITVELNEKQTSNRLKRHLVITDTVTSKRLVADIGQLGWLASQDLANLINYWLDCPNCHQS